MVHPGVEPKACWEFEGDILILHHPTTISVKYQAMGKHGSAYRFLPSVWCLVCRCGVELNAGILRWQFGLDEVLDDSVVVCVESCYKLNSSQCSMLF